MPTPAEIKKALVAAGLEVYRTRGEVVYLAERVRENLLMDSGIFVHAGGRIGFAVRAQRSDFPNDDDARLFERARALAGPALASGYHEADAQVRRVIDPGDSERTIDVWCEIHVEKAVGDIDAVLAEAKFALSVEKAAPPR